MSEQKEMEIRALLVRAESAHGEYESRELNGVYDQNWPNWYANYIVSDGLSKVLQREITSEELSQFLANSFEKYKQDSSGLSWEDYTARELIASFYQ